MPVDQALARNVIGATGEELLAMSQLHSCIVAASVLTAALARKGIDSQAIAVEATVFNSIYAARLAANDWKPLSQEDHDRCRSEGGAVVQVGGAAQPGEEVGEGDFDGHVAVLIPDFYPEAVALVDLAIVQANEPDLGVILSSLLSKVKPGFLRGAEPHWTQSNDCAIYYCAIPSDTRFMETYVWTEGTIRDEIVDRALARLSA